MSAYVPLLTIEDKDNTVTVVVDSVIMWMVPASKDKTTIYFKTGPYKELVLAGDFSEQLKALYYPPKNEQSKSEGNNQ